MNENYLAKVGINKSLLKEFNVNGSRTVYMNNGEEFQIQIFNNKTYKIACDIYIEGESIGNLLILEPGERCWLERFLDKHSKFKFNTYTVEGDAETRAAIAHNGEIKIVFSKATRKKNTYNIVYDTTPSYDFSDYIIHNKLYTTTIDTTCEKGISDNALSCTNISSAINTITDVTSTLDLGDMKLCSARIDNSFTEPVDTIETGRIDEGSYSDQEFRTADVDIKETIATEYIKILPQSQKPCTTSDLQKIYCTECGHKLNQRYKFCPYCGTKVE